MHLNRLQLQSSSNASPGDLGFKLVLASRNDPTKLVRIWVRRKKGTGRHVWSRYLDPVAASSEWEVRLHVKRGTGAMTMQPFSVADLDGIAEEYEFLDDMDVSGLSGIENSDPLFNALRDWVVKVTSAQGWPDLDEASIDASLDLSIDKA